jgi:hypothetical protein
MGMHAAPVRESEEFPEVESEAPVAGVGEAQPLAPDPDAKGEAATEAFARDHEELTDDDERDALDFLLAPKPARLYGIPVQYDTEKGVMPLIFVVRGMDGRKIDAIEQRNVSAETGKLDAVTAECQLIAEACVFVEGRPGHQVKVTSDEFLTVRVPAPTEADPRAMEMRKLASPADALEARFKTQLGLLSGVAAQIRRISGYDPRRVGEAERRLIGAVGNS